MSDVSPTEQRVSDEELATYLSGAESDFNGSRLYLVLKELQERRVAEKCPRCAGEFECITHARPGKPDSYSSHETSALHTDRPKPSSQTSYNEYLQELARWAGIEWRRDSMHTTAEIAIHKAADYKELLIERGAVKTEPPLPEKCEHGIPRRFCTATHEKLFG